MTTVSTVRGTLGTQELGRTLMHEHVFLLSPELRGNFPQRFDANQEHARAVAKLKHVARSGISTIVDPTVLGMGRDILRVKAVADEVGVHIIPATGCYVDNELPRFAATRGPGYVMFPEDEDILVELFVADIERGIAGTGIRAAFLKCAVDTHGVTPSVERVLNAVAAAHTATGVPVMVHTDARLQTGLAAQAVLCARGVDASKLLIAHCGDSVDLDYLTRLMDAGSIIGMDRFGVETLLPFEDRVRVTAALCARGYAGHMVLAHDACCVSDWFPADYERHHPRWTMTHIPDEVVPALLDAGVSERQIDTMLRAVPRAYFE